MGTRPLCFSATYCLQEGSAGFESLSHHHEIKGPFKRPVPAQSARGAASSRSCASRPELAPPVCRKVPLIGVAGGGTSPPKRVNCSLDRMAI